MIRIILSLLLATSASAQQSIALTPSTSSVTTITAPERLPTECETCMKARPIKRSKQWETDHQFAHHLVEVMLRMEARRHTVDASALRPILQAYRDQLMGAKLRDKRQEPYAILEEALKTLEELIYRVERVEAELRRCDEARKAEAKY